MRLKAFILLVCGMAYGNIVNSMIIPYLPTTNVLAAFIYSQIILIAALIYLGLSKG